MLRGIHPLLGPELLYMLQAMGHGDEIVIADGNFPAETLGPKVVRADGVNAAPIAEAILTHFPLDSYVPAAAFRMAVVENPDQVPDICVAFQELVHRLAGPFDILAIERFDFYARARQAACIVATGERAIYANLILKKGVVAPDAE